MHSPFLMSNQQQIKVANHSSPVIHELYTPEFLCKTCARQEICVFVHIVRQRTLSENVLRYSFDSCSGWGCLVHQRGDFSLGLQPLSYFTTAGGRTNSSCVCLKKKITCCQQLSLCSYWLFLQSTLSVNHHHWLLCQLIIRTRAQSQWCGCSSRSCAIQMLEKGVVSRWSGNIENFSFPNFSEK